MYRQYRNKRLKRKKGNPELIEKIEIERNKLNRLIRAEGMENEKVLELSRDLDILLLEYYVERPLGKRIKEK